MKNNLLNLLHSLPKTTVKMGNYHEVLYFFKIGLEQNIIEQDLVKHWSDNYAKNENEDKPLSIFEFSISENLSQIITIINQELGELHEFPDLKTIGKALVGTVSKKLNKNIIDIDKASEENFKIQYMFIRELGIDLDANTYNEAYLKSKNKNAADYEKEKKKLEKFLSECESIYDKFLFNNKPSKEITIHKQLSK